MCDLRARSGDNLKLLVGKFITRSNSIEVEGYGGLCPMYPVKQCVQ